MGSPHGDSTKLESTNTFIEKLITDFRTEFVTERLVLAFRNDGHGNQQLVELLSSDEQFVSQCQTMLVTTSQIAELESKNSLSRMEIMKKFLQLWKSMNSVGLPALETKDAFVA